MAASSSIPDLDDLAAYGHTDKDAVAHVTELASQRARAAVHCALKTCLECPGLPDGPVMPLPQRRGFGPLVSPPIGTSDGPLDG